MDKILSKFMGEFLGTFIFPIESDSILKLLFGIQRHPFKSKLNNSNLL